MTHLFHNFSKGASRLFPIPTYMQLIHVKEELRDKEQVEIRRYQEHAPLRFGGSHITVITSQEGKYLLSYTNMMDPVSDQLLNRTNAEQMTLDVMKEVDKEYAKGLTLLRVEKQTRSYTDEEGNDKEFPVLWVKMMHSNGSFNWVTLGGEGQVIEFERQVRWDYMASRRQTEMWYDDEWILARMGKGPQLLPPAALA